MLPETKGKHHNTNYLLIRSQDTVDLDLAELEV